MAKRRKPNLKNPNSRTWRNKADSLWSDVIRQGEECEICGVQGMPRSDGCKVNGLEAHHLIPKGTPLWREKFRHDLSNGVCLCGAHHSKYNKALSPHGDSMAQHEWWKWMKEHRPGQYQWYLDNRDDKRQPEKSYMQSYLELKEIKDGCGTS